MPEVNERVVITGGKGFVGRYLQQELLDHWPRSIVEIWDLPEVDITDPRTYRTWLTDSKPVWLIHLAAISSVPMAMKDPERTWLVNVEATRQLLEIVSQESPETAVFVVSTSELYGQGSTTPLAELSLQECKPRNLYAQSKWDMEQIIEEQFRGMTVRVRAFPHIGPGQQQGFVTADFASQIAAIEQGEQEAVMRVGNLEASRDFTDVRDVVRGYRLLMEQKDAVLGEVYNVASGVAVQVQRILDMLLEMSSVSIAIEPDPDRMRPSDMPMLVGDATKLRRETDWIPEIGLKKTLEDVLSWWRRV